MHNVDSDFSKHRLSPHFVYESYDAERKLFYNRGSVGFVLQGWPLVGANLQAQGEIAEFLNEEDNLPAEASFQVLMMGTKHIKGFLQNWASCRQGEIFQTLAKRRVEFLQKRANNTGALKDVILFFAVTVPVRNYSTIFIEEMVRRRNVLQSTLKSIGLYSNIVDAKELLFYLRLWFGWEDIDSHPEINPYDEISEQVLRSDFVIEVEEDRLFVPISELSSQFTTAKETERSTKTSKMSTTSEQGYAYMALEAVKRPSYWKLPMMDLFLGNDLRRGEQIKADFLQSFALQVLPRQAIEASSAMAKREALMKNLKSGLMKFIPGLEEEYEDINATVQAVQTGDRVVMLMQNTILKDIPSKIKERTHEYRSMMRRNGFHFVPCKNDHLPVMLSCFPMQSVEKTKAR